MSIILCELKNIKKTYHVPSSDNERLTILDGVSLLLNAGGSAAIVGPSGSGKTTLLNIAASLDLPNSGDVFIDGVDISKIGERERAVMRNKKIGIVFQRHNLLPQCTLLENVLVPTLPFQNKIERETSRVRALKLIDRLGLSQRINHFPAQLSGGECQRAALTRALVNKPQLLCADEPTGSLDQKNADEMGRLLRDINMEEETALLVVTHSEKLAAIFDNVYTLNNGKLSE